MKLRPILAALAASAIGAQAAPIFSENFESLAAGSSLSGQGGWTGSSTATQVIADPGSFGFSGQIAENLVGDSQTSHAIGGLSDADIMTAEYDLKITGGNSYTYLILNQSGVSFGVEYGNMTLRGADGGTKTFSHGLPAADNIYHMVMKIDPTAYSGAGSATVTFAPYTAESTLGAYTTAFSNVQLDLDVAAKRLSKNTGFNLRIARNTGRSPGQVDNISFAQGPNALVQMAAATPQSFENNGSNQTLPIAFSNVGSDTGDTLDITGVTLSGPDAALFTTPTVWTPAVAANGGTGTIDLPFVPAGALAGTYHVTLEVASDAANSPFTIDVNVDVADPVAVVTPGALAFGDFTQNPGPQNLTVNIANNGGSHALNIYGIDVFDESSSGAFTVGSYPATLAPGANVDVTIVFNPGSTVGLFTGNLEIDTDGSKQTLFTIPLSATVTGTAPVAVFTESFDALTTGISLSGQGGWGGPTGVQVVADPGSFGLSGNIAEYSGNDNEENHPFGGLNDIGLLTMEFDLRINGDTSYTYWILGQSGISVGVERGNMTLRGAAGGTRNFDHNLTGDNIYHMVLTIDPAAFDGDGAARMTYAPYTAETTLGTAKTAFSGVWLDLNAAGKKLSQNRNFVLRMHNAGAVAQADNLRLMQVPEPVYLAALPQTFTNDGTPQTLLVNFSNVGVDGGQTLDITGVALSGPDASFFTTPTVWTGGVAANGGTGTISLPFDFDGGGEGDYIVTLEVSSNATASPYYIDVKVTVSIPMDYDSWATGNGYWTPGAPNTGPTEDFDGDGMTNGEEYAFGLDPTKGSSVSPVTPLNKATGTFTYTRRDPALSKMTYVYESSTTLAGGGWTEFTPVSETPTAGDTQTVTVTLPAALLTNPKLFVRVVATQ